MPWDAKTFAKRHYHAATGHAGQVAARVANDALARGKSDKMAVIAGIMAAKNARQSDARHKVLAKHAPKKRKE